MNSNYNGQAVAISGPVGAELAAGINIVANYVLAIDEKMAQYWQLQRQFRNPKNCLELKNASTISQFGIYMFGILAIFTGIFFGTFVNLFFGALDFHIQYEMVFFGIATMALVYRGRKHNKKATLILGYVFGGFLALSFLLEIIRLVSSGILLQAIAYIVFSAAAAVITYFIFKKINKKINKENMAINLNNNEVRAKRAVLAREIQGLKAEMLNKTGSWFPRDYYSVEAVDAFARILRNKEAYTVEQMVRVYKEDKFRNNVITNQEEIRMQINKSLENQNEMIQLQRRSNILQTANVITNMEIADNTAAIRSNTAAIAKNTADANYRIGKITGDSWF